jgi:hypothetical protein
VIASLAEQSHDVAADVPGTAGDEDPHHESIGAEDPDIDWIVAPDGV